MEPKKKPGTPSDLLDCLSEFLAPAPEESADDLRAQLREEGVDPDRVVARVRQLVEAKLKEDRLGWQAKAQRERATLAQSLAAVRLPGSWSRDEMFARVRDIIAGAHGSQPAFAHFRNYEKMADDDLRSLLEDYQRVVELEKNGPSEEDGPRGAENG